MRYGVWAFVFLFCLIMKAEESFGGDGIPLEAYAIPVKQRRYLPPKSQVASISSRSSYSARSYQPVKNYGYQEEASVMLSPMMGTTVYSATSNSVQNGVTSGLALDILFNESLSGELGGGFGSFNVRQNQTSQKEFNQYWAGAGMKYYFTRAFFARPFLGLGIEAINYDNLAASDGRQSQWMGVTGASVGMDIHLSERFALAARGGWHHPLVNRATTSTTGAYVAPGQLNMAQEVSIANGDFFRLMGAVKVAL